MKKDIIFTLPAEALEGATEVTILGDFNNWTPDDKYKLEKQKDGSYKTSVALEEGQTYQYRFLLSDGRWVNDYHAQNYQPVYEFSVENSVITVPETSKEQAKEQNTSSKPEAQQTSKKEKAPKEKAEAKAEPTESKTKKAPASKAATSKAATAKPAPEKVAAKKSEKTEKATKTTKKEAPKK